VKHTRNKNAIYSPVESGTVSPKVYCKLPDYCTARAVTGKLPTEGRHWFPGKRGAVARNDPHPDSLAMAVAEAASHHHWHWPERPIFFIADPHADAEAFVASLLASGGVRRGGPQLNDFTLTPAGRKGLFIIGGDCLDKGPSNLELLRSIRHLMDTGARVKLLAGNHDVRLLMGIRAMELKRDPRTEHLFVRMGDKVVPLLREVHEHYLKGKKLGKHIPSEDECRERLFPSPDWFEEFPHKAHELLNEFGIRRELTRMRKKVGSFEGACRKAGLSLRDVYATALQCRELFLKRKGEFAWFFREMQLAYHDGSFLFIHAGLDDTAARLIAKKGLHHLNKLYRHQIKKDLFAFYYGPLANTMRTKYRAVDRPLSEKGVRHIYKRGLHAVVHGHRNRLHGQQIMLRHGLIHIESDITLDRNSRRKEGLKGYGAGVTIVRPEGQVLGISTDHPYAKVFEPEAYLVQPLQANA
jgi:hypothetical protein